MALGDPCIVSCQAGRAVLDTREIDVSSVLNGLPGRCPRPVGYTGRPCPTRLCAFSGAPNRSGTTREVCCVVGARLADPSSVNTSAGSTLLPAIYLSLAYGEALQSSCSAASSSPAVAQRSRCTLWLSEPEGTEDHWDASSAMVWVLATTVATLAAYLAAAHQEQEDSEDADCSGEPGAPSASPWRPSCCSSNVSCV